MGCKLTAFRRRIYPPKVEIGEIAILERSGQPITLQTSGGSSVPERWNFTKGLISLSKQPFPPGVLLVCANVNSRPTQQAIAWDRSPILDKRHKGRYRVVSAGVYLCGHCLLLLFHVRMARIRWSDSRDSKQGPFGRMSCMNPYAASISGSELLFDDRSCRSRRFLKKCASVPSDCGSCFSNHLPHETCHLVFVCQTGYRPPWNHFRCR